MPVNEKIGGIQVNISADTGALDTSLSQAKAKVTNWIRDQRERKIELTVSAKINEHSVESARRQLKAIHDEFGGDRNKLIVKLDATFKVTRNSLSSLQKDLNTQTKAYPIKVNVTPVVDNKAPPVIPVKGKFMGWEGGTPTVGVFAEMQPGAKGAAAAGPAVSFSKDADRIIKAINDCCAMGNRQQPTTPEEPTSRTRQQQRQQQQAQQQAQERADQRREQTQRRWDERRERRRTEADQRAAQAAARSQPAQKAAAKETGKAVADEIKESPVKTEKAPKEKAEEKRSTAPPPKQAPTAAPPAAAATPKPKGTGFAACPDCGAQINMSSPTAWADHRKRRHGEGETPSARTTTAPPPVPPTTASSTAAPPKTTAPAEKVAPSATPAEDPMAAFAAKRAPQGATGAIPAALGSIPTAEELGAEAMARATPPEAVAAPQRQDANSKICSYCGRIFSSPSSRRRHEQIHQRAAAEASSESEAQGRATQARARVGGRGIPKNDPEMAAAVDMVYKKGIFEEMPLGEDPDFQHRMGRLARAGVDVNRLATEGILSPREGQEATYEGHPEVEAFQRDIDKAYEARRGYLKEELAAELSIRPEAPGKRTNLKAEALRQAIEDPTAGYAEQVAAKGSRADMLAELGISEESRSGFNMRALKGAVGGAGLRDFIAGTGIQGFDPSAEVEIPTSGGKTTTVGELRKRNQKRYEELQDKYEAQLEEEGKATRMTVRGETKMVPRSDIRLAERYRQGGKWNFGAGVQGLTEQFGAAQTPEDYELVARQAFRMSAEQRRLYSGFDVSKMQRDIEKRGIDFEGMAPEAQSDFMGQYKINDKREQGRRRKRFRQLFSEDFPRGSDTEFGLTGLDLGAVQTRGVGEISDVILALTSEVQKNTKQATDQAKATMSSSRGKHGEEVPYLPPEARPPERMVREEISAAAERDRRRRRSLEAERERAEALRAAGRDPFKERTAPSTPTYDYAMSEVEKEGLTPAEINAQRAATGRGQPTFQTPEERAAEAAAVRAAAERRARIKAASDAEDAAEHAKAGGTKYKPFVPPPRSAEKGFGYAGYYNPEAQIPAEQQEQFLASIFGPSAPMPQGAGGPNQLGFAAKAKPVQTRHCDVCGKDIATSYWAKHTTSAGHRQREKATQQPDADVPPDVSVSDREVNDFMKNLRAAKNRGEDVGKLPTRKEARDYLTNFKTKRINVEAPVPDMPFSDAEAEPPIPPNKVRGMGGKGGGPVHVWVDNWPKGFAAGSGIDVDEIKRMAKTDPDFAKRMVAQGVLPEDFMTSARKGKVRPETTEEEQAEEAAAAAKRRGAPTRSQIAKAVGEVNFGKARSDAQDDYEDMLDVVQDQQNFAREVLEENPVRALSVAVSQVAVNLTGRAELKNAITAINRSSRRATRFATDANDAMVNLDQARKAWQEAPDDEKPKWKEAIDVWEGALGDAKDNFERVAGIPFALGQEISKTTDPARRASLVREGERMAMAQEGNAENPETLFGRTGRLRQQRGGILARTALVGTAGIVGGTFLFTAAMAAFNASLQLGSEWLGRVTEGMTGFAAAANDLAKSLGQAALPTGRTEGGIRERFGLAGIGGATAEQLLGPIQGRVQGEVQAQRAVLMRDTLALAAQGLANQSQFPGIQNFAGNFQPTGGMVLPFVGQTNIGAEASVQETLAAQVGGLPSNMGFDQLFDSTTDPMRGVRDFFSGGATTRSAELQEDVANAILGGWSDALKRGGSGAEFVNARMAGITDQAGLTQQAGALVAAGGSPDLANRIFSGDIALVDAQGKLLTSTKDVAAAFDALGEGLEAPDIEQLVKSGARALEAAFYGIAQGLQNQLRQANPIQTFMQQLSQPMLPFGTGVDLASAVQGMGLQQAGVLGAQNLGTRNQLLSRAAIGATRATQMVNQFGPAAGVDPQQFASTMNQIADVGADIAYWQKQIADIQVGQQMMEYNRQVFVAQRNISDLQGLVHGVGDENERNIGILQRENLMRQRRIQDIQREGEAESLAMNQRQINFNRALAGFTSSGATPAEAAARAREAELQADFAQRQQDRQVAVFGITGEMIPAERKIVDEQNLRALEDAIAEFDLFQSRFKMDQATRLMADNIALSQQLLGALNQDMQAMLGALQQAQSVETQMVQENFARGKDTLERTAAVVKRVYNEVATDFARAFNITITGEAKGPSGRSYTGTSGTSGSGPRIGGGGTGGGAAGGAFFNTSGQMQLTVGEAGTETVAVLKNPRQMMFGGGGGNVQINFNGTVVKDQGDITKLALAVEEVMNRRARLYGVAR